MPLDDAKFEAMMTAGVKALGNVNMGFGVAPGAKSMQATDQPASDVQAESTPDDGFIWGIHAFGTHTAKVGI